MKPEEIPTAIDGVVLKRLVTHLDDRGFFREIVRKTDPFFSTGFGQWSHSLVHAGVVKAWHYHHRQSQWTYVACGVVKAVVHDARPTSATFRRTIELRLGDQQDAAIYSLPPGVVHGYRVLAGPAHVFYLTSGVYDPTDEGRLQHDDPAIGYDWLRGPAIT